METEDKQTKEENKFNRAAEKGLFRELLGFLWQNKLWWLIPILLVLILLVALMLFAAHSGAAAPLVYPLF
jgi:hypothetical protein